MKHDEIERIIRAIQKEFGFLRWQDIFNRCALTVPAKERSRRTVAIAALLDIVSTRALTTESGARLLLGFLPHGSAMVTQMRAGIPAGSENYGEIVFRIRESLAYSN